ncbi:MAG: T9SS type A sorting domain-containing protein [Bacteroidota bacterium]
MDPRNSQTLFVLLLLFLPFVVESQIVSTSPNTGEQNSSFAVTVTGTGTTWSSSHCVEFFDGVSTFSFTGTALNASTLSGFLNIPSGANVSSNYDITVYDNNLGSCSGLSDGTCTNCFTVTAAVPTISFVNPNFGTQCESFGITVSGTNTSWASGTTHCVEFTDGVSTFSFTGTANGSQQLTGTLNIPIDANPSALYDVTVYDVDGGACSGASDGTCTDCFTVIDAPDVVPSPTSGEQNSSFAATITGTGTTWSSTHCVQFSDGVSTFTMTGTALNASTLTGTLSIPVGANVSSNYDIKVFDDQFGNCSGAFDGLCEDCFSVTAAVPTISFINPNFGTQCESFGITVSGTNTSWASGTTHCVEFTDGVSTFSFTGTANGSQQLNGTLDIPIDANPSALYDVTIYDVDGGTCSGASDGTCTDCFTVIDAADVSPSPAAGNKNTTFSVTLTGAGTSWSSTHCVQFSNGTSTFTMQGTASNASTLTGMLTIPGTAQMGSNYDIKVFDDPSGNCSGDFDGICDDCFTVLIGIPVEWLSFKASPHDKGVMLDWQTATESNTDYFEIQRSGDGQNWESLFREPAQGFSTQVIDYQYFDADPHKGTNYYRILQVDIDGSSEFSEIVSIEMARAENILEVFPNPAKEELNIRLFGEEESVADLIIRDVYGRTVYRQSGLTAREQVVLSLNDWPAGVYLVILQNANDQSQVVRQVVKQ